MNKNIENIIDSNYKELSNPSQQVLFLANKISDKYTFFKKENTNHISKIDFLNKAKEASEKVKIKSLSDIKSFFSDFLNQFEVKEA